MRSAFRWMTGPVHRQHLADRIEIRPELDADEYELLSGELVQHVRSVRLLVDVDVIILPTASARSLQQIWLDLVRGQQIRFYPQALREDVQFEVRPDLQHAPTLKAYELGTLRRRTKLRLKSRLSFSPSNDLLTALAGELTGTLPEA